MFGEHNLTLRVYVAYELGGKYRLNLHHDSKDTIAHAKAVMSTDDWNLFAKCLKYLDYGELLVCKGSTTIH